MADTMRAPPSPSSPSSSAYTATPLTCRTDCHARIDRSSSARACACAWAAAAAPAGIAPAGPAPASSCPAARSEGTRSGPEPAAEQTQARRTRVVCVGERWRSPAERAAVQYAPTPGQRQSASRPPLTAAAAAQALQTADQGRQLAMPLLRQRFICKAQPQALRGKQPCEAEVYGE